MAGFDTKLAIGFGFGLEPGSPWRCDLRFAFERSEPSGNRDKMMLIR